MNGMPTKLKTVSFWVSSGLATFTSILFLTSWISPSNQVELSNQWTIGLWSGRLHIDYYKPQASSATSEAPESDDFLNQIQTRIQNESLDELEQLSNQISERIESGEIKLTPIKPRPIPYLYWAKLDFETFQTPPDLPQQFYLATCRIPLFWLILLTSIHPAIKITNGWSKLKHVKTASQ